MKVSEKVKIKGLIEELLMDQSVYTQEEISEWLKNEHGIDLSQSVISRYIREMGIVKGKSGYQLHKDTKQKKLHENFYHLLSEAGTEYYYGHSPLASLVLKCQPAYADLIAEKIEELFSTENDPCIVFTNRSGYLMIMVSKDIEKDIKEELNKIFDL